MMRHAARWLDGRARLHLSHGPIDLIVGADGSSGVAFAAAEARFATVLAELVGELDVLRRHDGPAPDGEIARRMHDAVSPFARSVFVTPMAAVAGAVAQTVLGAMTGAEPDLTRAYVNNGGDIALHLGPGQTYRTAISGLDGVEIGRLTIRHSDPARGVATSGWRGRSMSFGIADSVTVLADSAAQADAAATLIANAVDLPDCPGVVRRPADALRDDSDLGHRSVVTHVPPLTALEKERALSSGLARAQSYLDAGHILGAALHLQGARATVGRSCGMTDKTRNLAHV